MNLFKRIFGYSSQLTPALAPSGVELCKALSKACHGGDLDNVRSLLASGAKVNGADSDGNTPLHEASSGGHFEIVKLLIAKRADVNRRNLEGITPLSSASYFSFMSWKRKDLRRIAELLIAKGADVGIANSEGFGPLHWACKHGLKDLAELLIASGADVNNASLKGTTPLHMASEYGREKMEEIRSEIVTGNCRHLEVVRLLIAKGADVNRADLNGDTPLNVASCYGDNRPDFLDDIAELLISKGADVRIVNLEGFGPLHLAAKHGQKHLAELLIAGGANIDLLSLKGITPFDLAVKYGNTEIVELLIAKGVNANVANDDNIAQPSLSGGSPGEADEEFDTMSYDQLVEELVRLSREGYSWACVNGFVGMEKYPQYDAVRRIGQIIYRRDGYSGMQRACSTLRQRVILEPGHDGGQYVAEHSWTGIGDWRP